MLSLTLDSLTVILDQRMKSVYRGEKLDRGMIYYFVWQTRVTWEFTITQIGIKFKTYDFLNRTLVFGIFWNIWNFPFSMFPGKMTEPENMHDEELADHKTLQLRNNEMVELYRTRKTGEENQRCAALSAHAHQLAPWTPSSPGTMETS